MTRYRRCVPWTMKEVVTVIVTGFAFAFFFGICAAAHLDPLVTGAVLFLAVCYGVWKWKERQNAGGAHRMPDPEPRPLATPRHEYRSPAREWWT